MFTITVQESAAAALVGGSYIPDLPDMSNVDRIFEQANKIEFRLIGKTTDNIYVLRVFKNIQARLEATYIICNNPSMAHRLKKTRF